MLSKLNIDKFKKYSLLFWQKWQELQTFQLRIFTDSLVDQKAIIAQNIYLIYDLKFSDNKEQFVNAEKIHPFKFQSHYPAMV